MRRWLLSLSAGWRVGSRQGRGEARRAGGCPPYRQWKRHSHQTWMEGPSPPRCTFQDSLFCFRESASAPRHPPTSGSVPCAGVWNRRSRGYAPYHSARSVIAPRHWLFPHFHIYTLSHLHISSTPLPQTIPLHRRRRAQPSPQESFRAVFSFWRYSHSLTTVAGGRVITPSGPWPSSSCRRIEKPKPDLTSGWAIFRSASGNEQS